MKWLVRSSLGLVFLLGLLRGLAYLGYARYGLPNWMETYYLEAKMVLLAYRAERGVTLYPEWRHGPYVANFFGPAYFLVVGWVGRVMRSDIEGLFTIGRALSFTSGLLTSVVVGVWSGRRYGRFAGWLAGVVSLGTAPMYGFSIMVRPDVPAEFLGVLGFLLATRRSGPLRILGGSVLALAMLTKQTTAIYLIAAVLVAVAEGRWRSGIGLGLGAGAALVTVVAVVTGLWEPHFAAGLAGESQTPWELWSLRESFQRIALMSPETLILPVLGVVLWGTGATGQRELRPAVLAVILLGACIATSAKRGSDLNYYLGLRAVEGMAVAALVPFARRAVTWRRTSVVVGTVLAAGLVLVPGLFYSVMALQVEQIKAQFRESPPGRDTHDFYKAAYALVADPNRKILTDVGLIDLHRGLQADFGDPWLFRMLSDTGRLDPVAMRDKINAQYYQMVITSSEIDLPSYDTYAFGLPPSLVAPVRARYVRVDTRAGLFLYERRASGQPVSALRPSSPVSPGEAL